MCSALCGEKKGQKFAEKIRKYISGWENLRA